MLDYEKSRRLPNKMKTVDAIRYFGTQAALAKALGVSKQAVSQWGDTIPDGRAYQLQVITGGRLKVREKTAA
jgi:DNA-binding transcriptional regulator YdaS (Cro superfamily)